MQKCPQQRLSRGGLRVTLNPKTDFNSQRRNVVANAEVSPTAIIPLRVELDIEFANAKVFPAAIILWMVECDIES